MKQTTRTFTQNMKKNGVKLVFIHIKITFSLITHFICDNTIYFYTLNNKYIKARKIKPAPTRRGEWEFQAARGPAASGATI